MSQFFKFITEKNNKQDLKKKLHLPIPIKEWDQYNKFLNVINPNRF